MIPVIPADADSTAYSISTAEMDRRRRAYTTLIVSLLAGVTVSSIDHLLSAPTITVLCLLGLSLILVLSRFVFFKSFERFSQIRVVLNDSCIERTRGSSTDKYLLEDVVGFRTKRTTRGSIREITVRLSKGRRLSINALRDFEQFKQELQRRAPAGAARTEVKEPIDFDHPLFYAVFGVVMGLAATTAVRVLAALGEKGLKWTNLGIAGYAVIMGAYFVLGRPISQRYGARSRSADLLLGSLAILLGVVLAVYSLAGTN
jgi:hypothetical protein